VTPPRVGIVGARRRRQGLGPFVARDLVAAGARVPCFLGTAEATLELARRELASLAGVEARGYVDLDAMLEAETLDALAILCPAEAHAAALDAALRGGLHALCEKPLVWGEPDLARRGGEIVAAFERADLMLWENCQWPYALPAFDRLHPGALDAPPRRFEMGLEPASRGVQSLGDALPHALSLLQRLAPGVRVALENVSFSTHDPSSQSLTIRFDYRSDEVAIGAQVTLRQSRGQPRRAWLVLDGRRAERVVSMEDYQLSFAGSGRTVPIEDPLTLLISDFVAALRGAAQPDRAARLREITQRIQLLADVVAAYAREETR